ncbi:PREDICTED: uncharacterized protein LOC100639670 [Amphimedon queenslandica]|uniref:Ubiquitin-like domain-containing protein n=1 Tax=Amphimedon queenslandica TaxID=400682 RepID=A0A1X7TPM7_AMPQE|nr:PREDICTED: uncharacterized protein LOC100639670 [Amphimedon queenslandica]|eukprot:XP_003390069.1 PREDICTED: uncharacterized protein LOC100639670 [Amphimedon queenslandica]
MSQNVIVETRPEPDPGLVTPINEASSTATAEKNFITITVQFLNGQSHKFSVDPRATVYGLKWSIFKSKGFDEYSQYDVNNIVLTFGRKELNNDDRLLTDCGIKNGSTVQFAVKLRGAGGPTIIVFDEDLLDPEFDHDFTNECDTGRVYHRGQSQGFYYPYKRPYGWKRLALKVKGKYPPDDTWLGTLVAGSERTESSKGEWPVSYNGTTKEGTMTIAAKGYGEDKLARENFGRGFYSTPSVEIAADFARRFDHTDGKRYEAIIQNRVNLNPGHSEIIPVEKTRHGAEYYLTYSSDDLRPYGICIREVKAIST